MLVSPAKTCLVVAAVCRGWLVFSGTRCRSGKPDDCGGHVGYVRHGWQQPALRDGPRQVELVSSFNSWRLGRPVGRDSACKRFVPVQ